MIWIFVGAILVAGGALTAWMVRGKTGASPKEVLMARTFARLLDGEREEVLEEMRGLYRRTDQDVGVGLALGVLLRHLGKNQAAIRTHKSLANRRELETDLEALIHTELSADYLATGLLDRARSSLERAAALKPVDELMARYGERILKGLDDWDGAFKLIQSYGKRSGNDVTRRLGLLRYEQGARLAREGHAQEALAIFKKAIAVHERCLPAVTACSRHYRQIGKPKKARQFMEKHAHRFDGREWLAMEEFLNIALDSAMHDHFLGIVHDRLETDRDDWRSRMALARFHTETGAYQEAAESLLECLTHSPHTLLLHQRLWSLMLRMEQPLTILRSYQSQLKQDLILSDPFSCRACSYHASELFWLCPSCHRAYSCTERKL